MMAAVMTAIGAEGQDERGVHGHIWRGNIAGKKFWKGMGMHTTMGADRNEKSKEESRVYEVEGTKKRMGLHAEHMGHNRKSYNQTARTMGRK